MSNRVQAPKGGQDTLKRWTPSAAVNKLDMPAHTKMKYRQTGQSTREEIQERDLKKELEERETKSNPTKQQNLLSITAPPTAAATTTKSEEKASEESDEKKKKNKYDDSDEELASDSESEKSEEEEQEDDDDDDDDDDEELLREIEKIKKERELEAQKRQQQEQERLEREKTEAVLKGNPLLKPVLHGGQQSGGDNDSSFNLKRKWTDDVVFKNQARDEPTTKKKRFTNDTVRNDFHQKFLAKYLK